MIQTQDLRLLSHLGALAIGLSYLAIDRRARRHDFDGSSKCDGLGPGRVVECTNYKNRLYAIASDWSVRSDIDKDPFALYSGEKTIEVQLIQKVEFSSTFDDSTLH
jgi:hypothetical protein